MASDLTRGERPSWALLAPVPRARLTDLAEEYWRKAKRDKHFKGVEQLGWEIIGGSGEYSAVVDHTPGAERTDEVPLAKRISRDVKDPVYVLHLHEHYLGSANIDVYERGKKTGSDRGAYPQARILGLSLPGDPAAEIVPDEVTVTGVVLVEGVSAADVARAPDLGITKGGRLQVEDGPAGAIIYDAQTGDLPELRPVSMAFPDKDVYLLSTGPIKRRLLARVMRGGKRVGTFDTPVPFGAGPALDSIKGETKPRAILAALGIPPKLLSVDE